MKKIIIEVHVKKFIIKKCIIKKQSYTKITDHFLGKLLAKKII